MTKKLVLCLIFFLFAPLTIGLVFVLNHNFSGGFVLGDFVSSVQTEPLVYSSNELLDSKVVLSTIKAEDSTLIIIENYLKRYHSPLFPFAQNIVEAAQNAGVDPKLIVAIAQQESNLGKTSPENCFNAWGWGIHAKGTKCYNSWPEAIVSVTNGIAQDYCAKGYCDDPCVMMSKYTPRSNGSWCAGINHFLSDMISGDF